MVRRFSEPEWRIWWPIGPSIFLINWRVIVLTLISTTISIQLTQINLPRVGAYVQLESSIKSDLHHWRIDCLEEGLGRENHHMVVIQRATNRFILTIDGESYEAKKFDASIYIAVLVLN